MIHIDNCIYIYTHIYIQYIYIYIYISIYTHIDLPGLNPHQPNHLLFLWVQVTWPSPQFPAPPQHSPPGASHRPRAFQRSTPSSHVANARYGWSPHTPHPRWDPRQVPDMSIASWDLMEHLHVLPVLECPANCPIQFWKTAQSQLSGWCLNMFEPSQPGGNGVTHSHLDTTRIICKIYSAALKNRTNNSDQHVKQQHNNIM